jgi:hypothetical protein
MTTHTIRDPFTGQDVKISDRLTDRLRGRYAIGPLQPNGEPEFGWRQYETPPVQHEAADRIAALETERDLAREAVVRKCRQYDADMQTMQASLNREIHRNAALEADGREATRLLDLWSEIPGAEYFAPYQDTMAFLGKPNSVGWVWAREIREERDFDKEQARQRDLAMQCICAAEEREQAAHARIEALEAALREIVDNPYRPPYEIARAALAPEQDK